MNEALISVVIPNYNYQDYVGPAIDSALALDWPNVEVIVIDDGSTDNSREVIARYGTRIKTILQENSGQLVGCNKGFAMSRGEIVIFLDSDDVLHPSLARELMAVWTPKVSKVQVQMRSIDARGAPTGSYFPQYHVVPSAQDIRAWSTQTTAYPTPPGSGNAYSRWFLDRIFPLHDTCGTANDSYCLAAAPYLGDVLTIPKPLCDYRVHGKNQGALSSLDARQFARQMTRARQRQAYAMGVAASVGLRLDADAVNRSLTYLGYRLGSLKLAPQDHPLPGDSTWQVLQDVTAAFGAPQGLSTKARWAMLLWAWAVGLLPAPWGRKLVLWRFAPATRPQSLRRWMTRLKVVRG
jgi:glycosyltransferase involved in cell wall biosynthesis